MIAPEILIYIALPIIMFICFEVGYQVGRWRAKGKPEEKEGPTGMLVGSMLALMAFLIAIVMGMTIDRFDARRGLVVDEANAIGTAYLRAGYIDPVRGEPVRELLREYLPLRITISDAAQLSANLDASMALTDQMWTLTEQEARANPESEVTGLFVDSVNEVINVQTARATAIDARVPQPIIFFVVFGSILAISLVGYHAGLMLRRSLVAAVLLVLLFSTVIALVIDLNQPASGLFVVSQKPFTTLQSQIGAP